MNASKLDYIYPDLNGHKVLYKGKRFWIFEISKEFPFRGYEEFCDVIVYDKKDLTKEEIKQIEDYFESQEFHEEILQKHLDKQQAEREDAAEAAYEARKEAVFSY